LLKRRDRQKGLRQREKKRATKVGLQKRAEEASTSLTITERDEVVHEMRNPHHGEFVMDAVRSATTVVPAMRSAGQSSSSTVVPVTASSSSTVVPASVSSSSVVPASASSSSVVPLTASTDEEFEETCTAPLLNTRLATSGLKAIANSSVDKEDAFDEVNTIAAHRGIEGHGEVEGVEGIDLTLLVCYIMRYASRPVYEERELTAYIQTVGAIKCPKCARMPDRVELAKQVFSNRGNLHKHMRGLKYHNPLLDLTAEMVTDDPAMFTCPSQSCNFQSESIDDVYEHTVSRACKDRAYYKDLHRQFGDVTFEDEDPTTNDDDDDNSTSLLSSQEIDRLAKMVREKFNMNAIQRCAAFYNIPMSKKLRKNCKKLIEQIPIVLDGMKET